MTETRPVVLPPFRHPGGEATRARLNEVLSAYYPDDKPCFEAGKTRIPLAVPTFGKTEVLEAIDSLLSGFLTMGKKCRTFEEIVEHSLGVKNALFVNSGSSANLLGIAALANVPKGLQPGDEVITPVVTWSTTVWPLLQMGLKPVFVDVDPETFTIDVTKLEAAISPKTKAISVVHLLGNPADMTEVLRLANYHDLLIFEDCCEALGASWKGKPVGTIGDAGSFSTYFSHHITTIEGGLTVTNRHDVAEAGRALREHGWTRNLHERKKWAAQHPEIDDRFLFASLGYNLRPTEIAGAFGIHQWAKLDEFLAVRKENHDYWTERLAPYADQLHIVRAPEGSSHFSFAASPTRRAKFTRAEWSAWLERHGIETRPIMTGNFLRHPVWARVSTDAYRASGTLEVADFVSDQGLLWGNHHLIGPEERAFVADVAIEFLEKHA